jgi:hypothetical protein
MAVTIFGIIQHRRGLKTDLPVSLKEGELGFCVDTRELFIGNSPAVGGNTQVLTEYSQVMQAIQYEFVSDTRVPSQTGESMNQPIVRSLQLQLDDSWVNVKAYGAKGDGITDDTAAINRAIEDLYTKQLTTFENEKQTRKTIWFPSGEYMITQPLLIYPFVCLKGEAYQNTVIHMDNMLADHVLELVDSLGQTQLDMGLGGATLPEHIQITDLTLSSAQNIDLVWVARFNNVVFNTCEFKGIWNPLDPVVPGSQSVAVRAESLGDGTTSGQLRFINCIFTNIELAFYSNDPINIILFSQCQFRNLFKGILTETRTSPTSALDQGPYYIRVCESSFENVDDHAIQVMSSNPGVVSMANVFVNVGVTSSVVPVLWSSVSTKCVSMADTFDTGGPITNLGTSNLINNA